MGKVKSGYIIHRRILIRTISLFPVYLEWTKAILRTTLQQNIKEELLLGKKVAAMLKIKKGCFYIFLSHSV